jgi:hypothetical protein
MECFGTVFLLTNDVLASSDFSIGRFLNRHPVVVGISKYSPGSKYPDLIKLLPFIYQHHILFFNSYQVEVDPAAFRDFDFPIKCIFDPGLACLTTSGNLNK